MLDFFHDDLLHDLRNKLDTETYLTITAPLKWSCVNCNVVCAVERRDLILHCFPHVVEMNTEETHLLHARDRSSEAFSVGNSQKYERLN